MVFETNNTMTEYKWSLPYMQPYLASLSCLQTRQIHDLYLQVAYTIWAGNPQHLDPFQRLQKEHDTLLAYQNKDRLPQTRPKIQTCQHNIANKENNNLRNRLLAGTHFID